VRTVQNLGVSTCFTAFSQTVDRLVREYLVAANFARARDGLMQTLRPVSV